MEIRKIILTGQNHLTSDEKDLQMVKSIERAMNTGPIIGESREVLLQMCRNIMVRDILLDVMGCSIDQREKMFLKINETLAEKDQEILTKRKLQ